MPKKFNGYIFSTAVAFFCSLIIGYSQNYHWAKAVGSFSRDVGVAITVDKSGNVYSLGYFSDTVDFDPGPGVFTLIQTSVFVPDMYITKLDSLGKFIWAKRLGGTTASIFPKSIAIDEKKNCYITGEFGLGVIDFDPGPGTATISSQGGSYCFILKLDSNGNYKWCKAVGSYGSNCAGNSISTNNSGYLLVAGYFNTEFGQPIDFDPAPWPAVTTLTTGSSNDSFVLKLDTAGNFTWVKAFTKTYGITSITSNNAGDVYSTGIFLGMADFDPGPATYTLPYYSSSGFTDVFVSKLDINGNFVWAKSFDRFGSACTGDNAPSKILLDNFGNVYTTGYFKDTVDFDPGPSNFTVGCNGPSDIFISKLDLNGNFIWAKIIGGSGSEYASSFALDTLKNPVLTGFASTGCDFDPGPGVYTVSCIGQDGFVTSLDQNGNFIWTKMLQSLSPSSYAAPRDIAIDQKQNIFVTGEFVNSVDFNPDLGQAVYNSNTGSQDIFILKLGKCNFPLDVSSSPTICTSQCATLTANGASSYTWSTSSISSSIVVCPSITTTYTVAGDISSTCIQSNSVNVIASSCTGIGENDLESSFILIYPNPAKDHFEIELRGNPSSKAIITDIAGKEVKTVNLTSTKQMVDISDLSAGCYIIGIIIDGRMIHKKIIKE
jgi:hypothetical protein